MIKDIKELNFPVYATMSQATVTLQDMAEKTITSQVKIDGQIAPDFSYDWAVEFKGEKYIMPLRKPQGSKSNESLLSNIDLTFQHWAVYQLKRWYFCTIGDKETGTAIPDQYYASVSLNLKDFCALFNRVLDYYFNGKITLDFNDPEKNNSGWHYDLEPTVVEISNSYIWDVLIKFYELYAVRWQIEPRADNDNISNGGERYVIKVGYPTTEIGHVFEYGFEGGLLKVERQVQDDNIHNMIIGRGGEKNLPYRYFKKHDADNANFSPDPDWIPELKDIYFSELRGATFRSYIQGWKAAHIEQYRNLYPDEEWIVTTPSADKAYAPWAWMRGNTDEKFRPIEYVADLFTEEQNGYGVSEDSSIAKFGELMGGLESNEEIYPTIQGVTIDGLGRIDETVSIMPIESDDIQNAVESDAQIFNVTEASAVITLDGHQRRRLVIDGSTFSVPDGKFANFDEGDKTIGLTRDASRVKWKYSQDKHRWSVQIETYQVAVDGDYVTIENAIVEAVDMSTGIARAASGIPQGQYRYRITVDLYNSNDGKLNVSINCPAPRLTIASVEEQWSNTWDIWVKNLWLTEKREGESDAEYASRVWGPILGDHLGNEAKIAFSDGMLGTNEDYEFVITSLPVHDESRSLRSKDGNTYPSHWRITLGKCDADYEATGLYLPSTKKQASDGDHIIFLGIDMPHLYVKWAEEKLDDWKKDVLREKKDIKPTWVVSLDKVRIHNYGEANAIIDKINVGDTFILRDKRFTQGMQESLYISSVTYTFSEPTDKEANLLPEVEVTLSDSYTASSNVVATISGEINAIQRQLGSISNIEQIVRAIGDRLYLRKDGFQDRSLSPTEFASLLTSENFRNGIAGGQGWGFFKDANGNWVLETDRVNVRQVMQVNSMVINQIQARGGMTIESAASMELTKAVETGDGYICYFDQRGGSVANTFVVDDVVMCNRFTPENNELKFYKRRVIAVSDNSITLSKTDVNGDGIPEDGDNIVQYGNYTDKERQYVIVRDVVGGGYERYIEGLDSVDSSGVEYYFAGRQSGVYNGRPRFFVGDENGFIEYKDGKFLIKGEFAVGSDLGGLTSIGDGLILSSEINLGQTLADVTFEIKSGMSGRVDHNKPGDGLAFWAGGDNIDPDEPMYQITKQPSKVLPKFGVRFDGTAFAAGNTLRFHENMVWVGESVILDEEGLKLYDTETNEEKLRITNSPIPSLDNLESVANKPINIVFNPTITAYLVQTPGSGISQLPGLYLEDSKIDTCDLGEVTSGSTISGTITADVVSDYDIVSGYIEFSLYRGSNLVQTQRGYFKQVAISSQRAEISFNYTAAQNAEYSITTQVRKGIQPAKPYDLRLLPIAINGKGKVQYGTTTKTVIGRDGFASFWEGTVLGVKAGDIMLRSGNYGIRITSTGGVQKLVGGSRWESADI